MWGWQGLARLLESFVCFGLTGFDSPEARVCLTHQIKLWLKHITTLKTAVSNICFSNGFGGILFLSHTHTTWDIQNTNQAKVWLWTGKTHSHRRWTVQSKSYILTASWRKNWIEPKGKKQSESQQSCFSLGRHIHLEKEKMGLDLFSKWTCIDILVKITPRLSLAFNCV